ncbi:DUF4292 domain-containing protein [Gaetbulibacter aestuarii]|uniref:DUF4292 domain-containing protein n=1 Tax=Gaetbulibacter aestuarii TaxID=1502358 RepID=A0ABW7MUN7_9FLAO
MTKYTKLIIVLFLSTLFSCGTTKTLTSGEANYKLSTKQLLRENTRQTAKFRTLDSKVKLTYDADGRSQSYNINLRMEKDKKIWISSSFSVVKAMITPEGVSFYNKLDKTYFEGGFSYLSEILGIQLDYTKAQNLILGELLYPAKGQNYTSEVSDNNYVLQPKNQSELFELFFLIDPAMFKVSSQQIAQSETRRLLQIDYQKYQEVQRQILPEDIRILAVDGTQEAIIELDFKNTSLNESLRFPFKIPSGYKKIEL